MAVRIRLKRVGRRHHAAYRLAAMDSRRSRDSVVIEELGIYDPVNAQPDKQVLLKRDRIEYWIGVGAQPSPTVRGILEKQGIAAGKAPKRPAVKPTSR